VPDVISEALDACGTIVAKLIAAPETSGGVRFGEVSAAFEGILGYNQADARGLPLGGVAAPETAPALRHIASAMENAASWRGELVCLHRDGLRRISIECDIVPLRETSEFLLIGRDATERNAALLSARALNHLMTKSFQAVDLPLAIVAADGRFVVTNSGMNKQLGCAASPAGRLARDYMTGPDPFAGPARNGSDGAAGAVITDVEFGGAGARRVPATLSVALVEGLDHSRFHVVTARLRAAILIPETPITTQYQIAGQLRFIDLDVMGDTVKLRWETQGKRAMQAAEQIIRKNLGPADTVRQSADRGFTICFATGTEADATERSTSIAQHIRRHLIGLGENEDLLAMQVVVARVAVAPGASAESQIARQLNAKATKGLREAQAPLQPPHVDTVYLTSTGMPAQDYVSPALRTPATGSAILPEFTLNHTLAPIHWAAAQENGAPPRDVLLDLNFDLFLRRDRTASLLAACATIKAEARPHYSFLLTGLPAGVTTSLMQDISRRLQPFCGGVGWHLDEWSAPTFDLRACGLAWAVVDAHSWAGPPSPAPERLKRVAGLLGAYGVKMLARNVASMDCVRALHVAGVFGATIQRK
jgi:GGDEF domain-containing protein